MRKATQGTSWYHCGNPAGRSYNCHDSCKLTSVWYAPQRTFVMSQQTSGPSMLTWQFDLSALRHDEGTGLSGVPIHLAWYCRYILHMLEGYRLAWLSIWIEIAVTHLLVFSLFDFQGCQGSLHAESLPCAFSLCTSVQHLYINVLITKQGQIVHSDIFCGLCSCTELSWIVRTYQNVSLCCAKVDRLQYFVLAIFLRRS